MVDFSNPAFLGWVGAWALVLLLVLIGLLGERRRVSPAPPSSQRGGRGSGPTAVAPGEKFRLGLTRTRDLLARRLRGALGQTDDLTGLTEALEQALIESDVGVRTTQRLLDAVRALAASDRTEAGIREALRREVREILRPEPRTVPPGAKPWVCLVVGVNGVGKTTTIGKLAARHREQGESVLLVAGDTFRAAAVDQLAVWADRTGAEIVRQAAGADPSAVAFDGIAAAVARKVDVVLVDTAGRLHTKVNLMEELKKIRRVVERQCPGAPHEVLLVLDATTGQNALSQARNFAEAVEVTGVVLTKLDGSARGGMAVAVRHELGLPVRYVGLGESAGDLQPFDPDAFLEGLLPKPV